ncbi:MAG: hypothetical protein L0211_12200 [Planctomycetaceae bacterium]|nr:hypothetical protein [Planctomycetaceae bacterium]
MSAAFRTVRAAGMNVMTDITMKIVRTKIVPDIHPDVVAPQPDERQDELANENGPANNRTQQEKGRQCEHDAAPDSTPLGCTQLTTRLCASNSLPAASSCLRASSVRFEAKSNRDPNTIHMNYRSLALPFARRRSASLIKRRFKVGSCCSTTLGGAALASVRA